MHEVPQSSWMTFDAPWRTWHRQYRFSHAWRPFLIYSSREFPHYRRLATMYDYASFWQMDFEDVALELEDVLDPYLDGWVWRCAEPIDIGDIV